MIDAWQFRPNQTVGGQLSPDKNEKSAIIHDRDYSIALNATQPWINRGVAVPMRTYSESAVSQFPDAFFDFIYVDAGHEYKHISKPPLQALRNSDLTEGHTRLSRARVCAQCAT